MTINVAIDSVLIPDYFRYVNLGWAVRNWIHVNFTGECNVGAW